MSTKGKKGGSGNEPTPRKKKGGGAVIGDDATAVTPREGKRPGRNEPLELGPSDLTLEEETGDELAVAPRVDDAAKGSTAPQSGTGSELAEVDGVQLVEPGPTTKLKNQRGRPGRQQRGGFDSSDFEQTIVDTDEGTDIEEEGIVHPDDLELIDGDDPKRLPTIVDLALELKDRWKQAPDTYYYYYNRETLNVYRIVGTEAIYTPDGEVGFAVEVVGGVQNGEKTTIRLSVLRDPNLVGLFHPEHYATEHKPMYAIVNKVTRSMTTIVEQTRGQKTTSDHLKRMKRAIGGWAEGYTDTLASAPPDIGHRRWTEFQSLFDVQRGGVKDLEDLLRWREGVAAGSSTPLFVVASETRKILEDFGRFLSLLKEAFDEYESGEFTLASRAIVRSEAEAREGIDFNSIHRRASDFRVRVEELGIQNASYHRRYVGKVLAVIEVLRVLNDDRPRIQELDDLLRANGRNLLATIHLLYDAANEYAASAAAVTPDVPPPPPAPVLPAAPPEPAPVEKPLTPEQLREQSWQEFFARWPMSPDGSRYLIVTDIDESSQPTREVFRLVDSTESIYRPTPSDRVLMQDVTPIRTGSLPLMTVDKGSILIRPDIYSVYDPAPVSERLQNITLLYQRHTTSRDEMIVKIITIPDYLSSTDYIKDRDVLLKEQTTIQQYVTALDDAHERNAGMVLVSTVKGNDEPVVTAYELKSAKEHIVLRGEYVAISKDPTVSTAIDLLQRSEQLLFDLFREGGATGNEWTDFSALIPAIKIALQNIEVFNEDIHVVLTDTLRSLLIYYESQEAVWNMLPPNDLSDMLLRETKIIGNSFLRLMGTYIRNITQAVEKARAGIEPDHGPVPRPAPPESALAPDDTVETAVTLPHVPPVAAPNESTAPHSEQSALGRAYERYQTLWKELFKHSTLGFSAEKREELNAEAATTVEYLEEEFGDKEYKDIVRVARRAIERQLTALLSLQSHHNTVERIVAAPQRYAKAFSNPAVVTALEALDQFSAMSSNEEVETPNLLASLDPLVTRLRTAVIDLEQNPAVRVDAAVVRDALEHSILLFETYRTYHEHDLPKNLKQLYESVISTGEENLHPAYKKMLQDIRDAMAQHDAAPKRRDRKAREERILSEPTWQKTLQPDVQLRNEPHTMRVHVKGLKGDIVTFFAELNDGTSAYMAYTLPSAITWLERNGFRPHSVVVE